MDDIKYEWGFTDCKNCKGLKHIYLSKKSLRCVGCKKKIPLNYEERTRKTHQRNIKSMYKEQ